MSLAAAQSTGRRVCENNDLLLSILGHLDDFDIRNVLTVNRAFLWAAHDVISRYEEYTLDEVHYLNAENVCVIYLHSYHQWLEMVILRICSCRSDWRSSGPGCGAITPDAQTYTVRGPVASTRFSILSVESESSPAEMPQIAKDPM